MRRHPFYPYLLVAPALALIGLVTLYPTLYSFYLSLHNPVRDPERRGALEFVGLDNFGLILTSPNFWESLLNTAIFGALFVTLTMVFAFLLALGFNQRLRLGGLYLVIIFLPWMLSEIVSGIIFRWLFLPEFGLLQTSLGPLLGDIRFLGTPAGAMGVVIGATIWRSLAFTTLLLLAGMRTIPGDIYDASAIDGASAWQTFWQITWELIRPTTAVTVLFLTIQGINATGLFLAITDGGPGRSTEVLSLFMYRETIEFFNFGYGAALSVIMLTLNGLLAAFYLRVLRSNSEGASATTAADERAII